jgi:glycosyltransferase involved in cell wall biosynthesis
VVELRRLVRSWRPDVVHAVIFRSEVVSVLAGLRSPVPVLVSLVNMQYDAHAVERAPSPRRLEAVRRFESVLLRGADRLHCVSEAVRAHAVDRLAVPPGRIDVVPRGRRPEGLRVDPAAVAAVRDELVPDGRPLVVNVGRHELQKGGDLLVEALGRLRAEGVPFVAAIAGREGNETAALRRAVAAAGLEDSVSLLGHRPDVAALMAAADVVAVTSRWEGIAGSVIEALGVGSPVVAFGVPAVAEVVGDAGVVVEPFDVAALADALGRVLGDDDLRAELTARTRPRFDERFRIDAVIDTWEHLYAGLARRPRGRSNGGGR